MLGRHMIVRLSKRSSGLLDMHVQWWTTRVKSIGYFF